MLWFLSPKTCRIFIAVSVLQLCSDGFAARDSYEIEKLDVEYREKAEGDDDTVYENLPLMGSDFFDLKDFEKLLGAQEPRGNVVVLDSMEARNYRAEIKNGNKAEVLGANPHYFQPDIYPDFGRRFVLQYPYREIAKNNIEVEPKDMTPKLVSPELFTAVAQKSALLSAARPKSSKDEIEMKNILRNGDYWNAVWKEDIDHLALRTKETKKMESIKAKIPPGSKLHDLLYRLKPLSPTLLYVINKRDF